MEKKRYNWDVIIDIWFPLRQENHNEIKYLQFIVRKRDVNLIREAN